MLPQLYVYHLKKQKPEELEATETSRINYDYQTFGPWTAPIPPLPISHEEEIGKSSTFWDHSS